MLYVLMVFSSQGRVIKGKKTHTYTHRQDKGSQNTLLLGKCLWSHLNPSSTLYQSQQTQSPHLPLNVKHGQSNFELSSLIPHIWIWSEGLLRAEASGPINNRAAELRVRQQSADEPVSTKHKAPSPYLRRTTLAFKKKMAGSKQSRGWYTGRAVVQEYRRISLTNYAICFLVTSSSSWSLAPLKAGQMVKSSSGWPFRKDGSQCQRRG